MLPFLHSLENLLKKLQTQSGFRTKPWPFFILGVVLLAISYIFMPAVVTLALSLALFLAPLWLPVLLVSAALTLWVILRRSEFIASQEHVLFEIKLPRSVIKTPLAMEVVLSGLHISLGESSWYKKYILGSTRPWWSLEIASIEGQVHFFIWTRARFRRIVEMQIYGQYPGAQVVEALDYTRFISAKHEEWSIFGFDFTHTSDDDPLPIKTYVEYGLDKIQKESEQTDPLATLIEFMASVGKGENIWLQFIIRTHKGEKYGKKNEEGKPYTWRDEAKKLVEELRHETVGKVRYKDVFTGEMRETEGFPNPTKGQSEKMAAVERNVSKLAFDVGIRGIYISTPEDFDSVNISGLAGIFKQFNSEDWNGIRVIRGFAEFNDYPWEIGIDKLKNFYRKQIVSAYRRRQFFYEPFDNSKTAMVMSTEELATLFHIPSNAVSSPALSRIQSPTSEAPTNLPT